jgi:hypothetical protein
MASHYNFVDVCFLAEAHDLTTGVTNSDLGVDLDIVTLGDIEQINKNSFRS